MIPGGDASSGPENLPAPATRPKTQSKPTASRASVALLAVTFIAACGDSTTAPLPDPPRATTITVSPATTELAAVGATAQLSAEVRDQNGQVMAGTTPTWASSAAAVATVSASGRVTAVANGSATITATAGSASGSATVTVAQKVATVAVEPAEASLAALGDTVRLTAQALDANGHAVADAEFSWESGAASVASVDSAGLVTAVANGSATITATAGSASGSATATVAQKVTTVAVEPAEASLAALGDTVRLTAEALDANGHAVPDAELSWESGAASLASVDSAGLVTAVANGSATITATGGSASGSATVTVAQEVNTVAVEPAEASLAALGDTVRLTAEALDANGHAVADAEFSWESGAASVASVGAAGLVTAVANGSVTITATVGSASGSATVTVAQEADAVTVLPTEAAFSALGDTLRLTAEALDANDHPVAGAQFSWESSAASVASVDSAGLVIAVANGTATIMAASGGASATTVVTVRQMPDSVAVVPKEASFAALGDTSRLAAEAFDANGRAVAGAKYSWESSAASVASVDAAGLVTAVANGSATITVTSGSASGHATVTVAQEADAVTVLPTAATLAALGDTLRLAAEALDANDHPVAGAEFSWESSAASVASVDAAGLVTAVANGSATITATSGSASGRATVTVAGPVPADSLSVRTVYAIPRNRDFVQAYSDSVAAALRHVQVWYRDRMDGLTFALADAIPEVCRLSVDDDFLTVHPGDVGERWNAALDAVSRCGPKHHDEAFIWIVYFDVDEPCWTNERPQTLGRGGGGLTMLGRWDLLGLTDRGNSLPCGHGGQPHGRWVGGLAHELGHAFGLPHPPGCDDGRPSCDKEALMWLGYARWPDTYLRDDEKAILRKSPFFDER